MSTAEKLNWTATGLCCMAAVLLPIDSMWLTVGLIGPALVLMCVGLMLIQREWNDMHEAEQLQARWREQRERAR